MCDDFAQYESYLVNEKALSTNTLECYMRDIIQYKAYIDSIGLDGIDKVEQSLIQEYMANMESEGISPSTILRKLSSIRSYYKYLVQIEEISQDPTQNLEGPKNKRKPPSVLTISEINKLMEQPVGEDPKSIRDKAMLELLYDTGIRVSELINLNLDDIDLKEGKIICCSTNNQRTMEVGDKVLSYLKTYLSESRNQLVRNPKEQSLFVNFHGRRMTRQGFWKIVKYYTRRANINKDITPHTLRHSFAIHLLKEGIELRDLQKKLGHSDLSTTQVYSNMIENTK